MKPLFDAHIAGDEGQAIFGEGRWAKVLKSLPVEAVANKLEQKWSRQSDRSSSAEKWAALDAAITEHGEAAAGGGGPKRARRVGFNELERWRFELVLTHCYPRLDENVSKMQNHLLKSPFCVHPKTGRVCVPIDPTDADAFDPMQVPTLGTLVAEINAYDRQDKAREVPDIEKTSMQPYMRYFEQAFLDPMYKDLRRQMRDEAEQEAAAMGDF